MTQAGSSTRRQSRLASVQTRISRWQWPLHTPTGHDTARKFNEINTQEQRVDYISSAHTDFPGTSEPERYADIARTITPAAAALGSDALSARESTSSRRAATAARALANMSELQRNGGGKHARAAPRSIANESLSAEQVYAGNTPAFPQAKNPKACNITAMSWPAESR